MLKRKKGQGKVRNAQPNEYDGIKFRSKLETYTYTALKNAGIDAKYEAEHFLLIPKFEYNGEKIRPMTYLPDFVGNGFIIECKGMITDSFPLRFKIFKYSLLLQGKNPKLYLVRKQKQVDQMIADLLKN